MSVESAAILAFQKTQEALTNANNLIAEQRQLIGVLLDKLGEDVELPDELAQLAVQCRTIH